MPRKQKKKSPAQQPDPMRWEFDPDIPTHDFFESGSLDEMWNLQEAVDCFVHWLEDDRFLTWEAVAFILPERDRPVFVKLMQAKLGLTSSQEQIAPRL